MLDNLQIQIDSGKPELLLDPSLFFLFVVRKYIITYAVTMYSHLCQHFSEYACTYRFWGRR